MTRKRMWAGEFVASTTSATLDNTWVQGRRAARFFINVIRTQQSTVFAATPAAILQPRTAIAWQILPHTVLRSGFGLFSDLLPGSVADLVGTNPPYSKTFQGGLLGTVGGTARKESGCAVGWVTSKSGSRISRVDKYGRKGILEWTSWSTHRRPGAKLEDETGLKHEHARPGEATSTNTEHGLPHRSCGD